MKSNFENPQIKTQHRICQVCGKNYTINTSNLEENLDNYPSVCLWCQKQTIHENIKKYAQNLNNKKISES